MNRRIRRKLHRCETAWTGLTIASSIACVWSAWMYPETGSSLYLTVFTASVVFMLCTLALFAICLDIDKELRREHRRQEQRHREEQRDAV